MLQVKKEGESEQELKKQLKETSCVSSIICTVFMVDLLFLILNMCNNLKPLQEYERQLAKLKEQHASSSAVSWFHHEGNV